MLDGNAFLCSEIPFARFPGLGERSYHTATLYKDYIIMMGGVINASNEGNIFSSPREDITIIDIKRNICQSVGFENSSPFAPREGHSACLYQENKIIVYGGFVKLGRWAIDEVLVFNLEGIESKNVWSLGYQVLKENQNIFERACHTAHIYQDQMFVFGGFDNQNTRRNDLLCLNLDTLSWKECNTSGQKPCIILVSDALYDRKLYVFGGYDKIHYMNDLFLIDLTTYRWEEIKPKGQLPSPRAFTHAEEINSKIYILGGISSEQQQLGDLVAYDIGLDYSCKYLYFEDENKWDHLNMTGLNLASMFRHKTVYHNDRLIICGGDARTSLYSIIIKEDKKKKKSELIQKHDEIYIQHLGKMFLKDTFSDVTFIIENQELPGHRNILATRCKYFQNLLESKIKLDSFVYLLLDATDNSKPFKIEINDIPLVTFKALLKFIYCNQVEANQFLAFELLQLSEKYLFPELKRAIEEFLGTILTLDNFTIIANISEKIEASILRSAICEFVIKNLTEIQQKSNLDDFPKSMLWEALFKLGSQLNNMAL